MGYRRTDEGERLLARGRNMWGRRAGDNPGSRTVSEVGKAPVEQHAEFIAETDQKKQMHSQPSQPSHKAL